MFNKKSKKQKYVTMYGVFKSVGETYNIDDLICTTATEEEAYEYLTRKTYIDNEAHYKMWCKAHDKNESEEAFNEYVYTVIAEDEDYKFSIIKMHYTYEEVASIIRCMSGYKAIGTSFESELENEITKTLASQETDDEDSSMTNDKVC